MTMNQYTTLSANLPLPVNQLHQLFDNLLLEVTVVQYIQDFEARERRLSKGITPNVKQFFTKQKTELLKRFDKVIKPLLSESAISSLEEVNIPKKVWLPLWLQVVKETTVILSEPLEEAGEEIAVQEYRSLLDFFGFEGENPISFTIYNRRAIGAFNPLKSISNINSTTQDEINSLVDEAIRNGYSYTRLRRTLSSKFNSFNTKPDKNGRTRADRIAINEIRERNSKASELVADELTKKGYTIVKRWVSRGDNKVRAEHKAYEKLGYIPEKSEFKDEETGKVADRPPTDEGCRCVTVRRLITNN